MKLNLLNKFALACGAGLMLTSAAQAQIEISISGSTAFRAVLTNRLWTTGGIDTNLFDSQPAIYAKDTNFGGNILTYSGTMANAIPSFGSTPVNIYISLSGSSEGMDAVINGAPNQFISATNSVSTSLTNRVVDLAFSDVYAETAYPTPFSSSSFDDSKICVIPIVFMKNNSLTGITNITRDQVLTLFKSSGASFPSSYFGGTSGNGVFAIGRNALSGTRATIDRDTAYKGTARYWTTTLPSGGGTLTSATGVNVGYDSGGKVRDTVRNYTNTIGYLGATFADINNAATTVLNYNGVPYARTNVINGSYGIWTYEHVMSKVGGLDANQQLLRQALINAFIDTNFTQVNAFFTNSFISLSDMGTTARGGDGANITP